MQTSRRHPAMPSLLCRSHPFARRRLDLFLADVTSNVKPIELDRLDPIARTCGLFTAARTACGLKRPETHRHLWRQVALRRRALEQVDQPHAQRLAAARHGGRLLRRPVAREPRASSASIGSVGNGGSPARPASPVRATCSSPYSIHRSMPRRARARRREARPDLNEAEKVHQRAQGRRERAARAGGRGAKGVPDAIVLFGAAALLFASVDRTCFAVALRVRSARSSASPRPAAGALQSAFQVGYGLTCAPGGWVADRYGGLEDSSSRVVGASSSGRRPSRSRRSPRRRRARSPRSRSRGFAFGACSGPALPAAAAACARGPPRGAARARAASRRGSRSRASTSARRWGCSSAASCRSSAGPRCSLAAARRGSRPPRARAPRSRRAAAAARPSPARRAPPAARAPRRRGAAAARAAWRPRAPRRARRAARARALGHQLSRSSRCRARCRYTPREHGLDLGRGASA